MEYEQIIQRLHQLADPAVVGKSAHFGIRPQTQPLGVSVPQLRGVAKELKKQHSLAQRLWDSGLHEARLLATMVADPKQMTSEQREAWVTSLDAWDVCDQACSNLFWRTADPYPLALEWAERPQEFVRRAGYVLMAQLGIHDKKAPDSAFDPFWPALLRHADDERNFVKKAINWTLRQLGKRNLALNAHAIQVAHTMQAQAHKSAQWIANDALRELTNPTIQARLRSKAHE